MVGAGRELLTRVTAGVGGMWVQAVCCWRTRQLGWEGGGCWQRAAGARDSWGGREVGAGSTLLAQMTAGVRGRLRLVLGPRYWRW